MLVDVVGAIRYIRLISLAEHFSDKISDSSNGKSGTIIPSTPDFLDLFKKLFPVASCRNGIQDEKTTPRS